MIPTNLRQEQIWLVVGSLMILATVALAVALLFTRDVLIPFVLAIFVTTMVSPLVDFLVLRWRLPGWLAILIALFVVLAVLMLLSLALIAAVQTIAHAAGDYSQEVADLSQKILVQLKAHRINVDQSQIGAELEKMLPGVITATAGTVTTVLSHGVLIVIFVVFLLAGRNPRQAATGIYAQIEATIRQYITTKSVISAVAGLLVGLILWMLGLRMAPLFGLLAFLLNFIPSIGSHHLHPIADSDRRYSVQRSGPRRGGGRPAGDRAPDDRQYHRTTFDGSRAGTASRDGAALVGVLGAVVGSDGHGAGRADRGRPEDRAEPARHHPASRPVAGWKVARHPPAAWRMSVSFLADCRALPAFAE